MESGVIKKLKKLCLGSGRLWILWLVVMILAFAAFLYSWPLMWHLILTPNIKLEKHYAELVTYKVTKDGHERLSQKKIREFQGKIEEPNTLVKVYAVLNIDKKRKVKFIIECDDHGSLSLDRRTLINLHGISPNNTGTSEVILTKGLHLLVLNIFNGPYKGWFRLQLDELQGEGPQPLRGAILAYLDQGNAPFLLRMAQVVEQFFSSVLLFGFGVFFLLIIYRQGDLAFLWPNERDKLRTLGYVAALVGLALLCSWFTVDRHTHYLNWISGQDYLSTVQWDRHRAVIDAPGQHRDHRHYRLFPQYVLEAFFLARPGHAADPSNHQVFFWFRYAIDVVTFLLCAAFWRKLGLGRGATLLGVSILTWATFHTVYNSDLNFSTHLDTTFYLLAGILCLQKRYWALLAVGMLAVLNKETALLIPLLPLAAAMKFKPFKLPKREVWFSLLGLGLCLGFYAAIRYFYGWTGVEKPHDRPGLHFLDRNLSNPDGIRHLFYALGPLPLLALAALKRAPDYLARWFWLIVPIWFAVHTFVAWWEEPRVFMVVMAFCFIPLSLFLAVRPPSDEPVSESKF